MDKLKTKAGIHVSVRSNPSSTLLLAFDKSVRTIELTREEGVRLGSVLVRGGRAEVAPEMRKLRARQKETT